MDRTPRKWDFIWRVLAVGLILGFGGATARSATFTASLDRGTIALGETATLSLIFSGGQPSQAPDIPTLRNLPVAYLGPSSQFSVINGQVSSSVTYNYLLTPRQAGDYQIPSISAEAGGQRLATQPLTLRVENPGTEAGGGGAEFAFARLILPRKELYLGETITAQLQVFIDSRVQHGQPHLTGFPAEGFNVGNLREAQVRGAQIGAVSYRMISVDVALQVIKTGRLTIGPVTLSVPVEVPSANRRRDLFDPFGMFNRAERRTVSIAAPAEAVQGLALPLEGRPAHFSGAIGKFEMTASAQPTNVAVGDPITLKVQITGSGSFDTVELPALPPDAKFKTYPATTKVVPDDPLARQGSKTFERVIVPESTEASEVPAFSFSFFDPETKMYRTVLQPAVPLIVTPAPSGAVPVIAARQESQPASARDIIHIKPRLGTLSRIGSPLVFQPWFLTLQSAPMLALLLTVFWRKRTDVLAKNPGLRRKKMVSALTREGLRDLRRFAEENQSDLFFSTTLRLVRENLGERLDLPAAAITEAILEERLRPRGAPEPAVAAIQEVFQACNLAQYSPVRAGQELATLIPQVEAALRRIQELDV